MSVKSTTEEQRIVTGIHDVYGNLYDNLGFGNILSGTRKDQDWNFILKNLVLARLANPDSQRRTASYLERDFGISIDINKLYQVMDHVYKQEERIKSQVARNTLDLFSQSVDLVFFDVSTLYFESFESDNLRNLGYSKDNKFKEVQVMLALVTTQYGLPISYFLFPGNTSETNTLLTAVETLRDKLKISHVTLVADRAMFCKENLALMEVNGISYIIACKLKSLKKSFQGQLLNDEFHPEKVCNEQHWCKEYVYENRRIIVSYSKKRALEDAKDRERLVTRLLKKAKKAKTVSIKSIVTKRGSSEYLKLNETDDVTRDDVTINEEEIAQDALWDGLHGVITNVTQEDASDILTQYRGLWQIEEAFRVNKHNLRMRPIYHWTEERIHAHICICFVAYSLAKYALYQLNVISKLKLSLQNSNTPAPLP
ncbi:MAG: IS1634 family transposase [Bradymonadia bacterium]